MGIGKKFYNAWGNKNYSLSRVEYLKIGGSVLKGNLVWILIMMCPNIIELDINFK